MTQTPLACQLDEFSLTKFHLDFHPPETERGEVTQAECSFDYDVGVRKDVPHQYRLAFRVHHREMSATSQPLGNELEAELVGYFSFEPDTPKERMDTLIRLNGVSILYGILRGIAAVTTGVCPGGKTLLPAVMPQNIVEQVEGRRQMESKGKKEKAAKPITKKATKKATSRAKTKS